MDTPRSLSAGHTKVTARWTHQGHSAGHTKVTARWTHHGHSIYSDLSLAQKIIPGLELYSGSLRTRGRSGTSVVALVPPANSGRLVSMAFKVGN